MYEPSVRRSGFVMRTTTARTTSPFLTALFGMACLTEHTTTSPTVAYRRVLPPRTRITMSCRAPELSATFSRVYVWIIAPSPGSVPHASASLYSADASLRSAPGRPDAPDSVRYVPCTSAHAGG